MRLWPFGTPKTPGFGLHRDFYLSVLSGVAALPSPREVVNPKGEAHAVSGYIAPIVEAKDPRLLEQPMERGVYVVTSLDKKTVLQLMVISREEANFDPEALTRTQSQILTDPEVVLRLRSTWSLLQFRVVTHDPMVVASLDFLLDLCVRLSDRTQGLLADPLARRYLLPHQIRESQRTPGQIDAREHVGISMNGSNIHTAGLRKFDMPELEIGDVPSSLERVAGCLLISIAQAALKGDLPRPGQRVGSADASLELVEGGHDRKRWEGIPCLDLIPSRNTDIGQALSAWATENGILN